MRTLGASILSLLVCQSMAFAQAPADSAPVARLGLPTASNASQPDNVPPVNPRTPSQIPPSTPATSPFPRVQPAVYSVNVFNAPAAPSTPPPAAMQPADPAASWQADKSSRLWACLVF